MKKFLCIFLSALLICALFIIPASAAESSLSGVVKITSSAGYPITSFSELSALSDVALPFTTTEASRIYVVCSLPSYESLNSVSGSVNFSSSSGGLLYKSAGSDTLVSSTIDYSVSNKTFSGDLSSLPSDVEYLVFIFTTLSDYTITLPDIDLDFETPSVWNGISDFIGGLFGAVGSILGGALNNTLLLMFLILIPLSGIVRDLLYYNFLNKRKKSNSINRYRAKRGNYGRDSYKEV